MRVYEFSKESGIPSKELVETLQKSGFDVKSHMSMLSEKELEFLRKKTKIVSVDKKVEKSEEKKVKPLSSDISKNSTPETNKQTSVASKKEPSMQAQNIPQKTMPITQPAPLAPAVVKPTEPQGKAPVVAAQEAPANMIEVVLEPTLVTDFAAKIDTPVNEVILTLLKWGILANKNQILNEESISRLATHYHLKLVKPVTAKKPESSKGQILVTEGSFQERLPVVVVMGHVDHGKTTLLDFIRKTRVAAKEKGGITQHVGAYEAHTPHGNIVFLDTPGHEAFSKMRMRGVKVADIAIMVIAADDGIMPQTVEAIKHAKNMEVPIIVAINKIDKVDATRLEVVKRQLAQQDLLPEDWGGQTVVVPISAKEGKNIDQLLEMIVLQAQMMELKADISGSAKGYILESKLEKGRGVVATLLCQHGIVKVGDYFRCGGISGKVSSLVNSAGQRIMQAGPSIPVQVAGFDDLPEAGAYFEVVTKEQYLKPPVEQKVIVNRVFANEKAAKLIIKTDANSSKEALLESIEKLSKKSEKGFTIVHAGIGDVSESDVMLAADTGSRIITLHVKADQAITALAHRNKVVIDSYFIIYKLLEALEEMAEKAKDIKMIRKKIGEATVLKVFDIKNVGVIAGAYIKDGRFSKDGIVVAFRGNRKIGEGKISSLQRDKKSVKEVHSNFECAFMVDGITDWAVDDRVECYIEVPETK
ncbi:MAG: translation initiation factor IF-2 [Candidatus Babeliales bacterium]|nr:translation initiation factor IF-2 [Candidatus Babeliales bacterium]